MLKNINRFNSKWKPTVLSAKEMRDNAFKKANELNKVN